MTEGHSGNVFYVLWFLCGVAVLFMYLTVDFASTRHASEIIQQRSEEGVLPSVHVLLDWSNSIQTCRLTRVSQVEDSVCRRSVGRLLGDGGHRMCHGRRNSSCNGLLPLVQNCGGGCGSTLSTQCFSTVNKKEQKLKLLLSLVN